MYSYSCRDFVYEPQKMHTSLCSISVDDDFFDCKWPSSPKRCDRGQSFCMDSVARSNLPPHASGISSGSTDSMRTRESVFSCCTEELGSESTSGVGHGFTAPMSYCNQNIFYEDHIASMPAEARVWTSTHQSHAATWRGTQSEDVSPPLSRNPHQICSPEGQPLCQYGHECHRGRCAPCGNVRTFPPPLSSLLCHRPFMRSFKSNGRFILKKIDNVSCSLFRSTRKDGRLRLDLLSCPCNGLHDQCSSLFPANSECLPLMSAPSVGRHHYHLDVPPTLSLKWNFSSTLASYKPTLSYKTLSPQALSMLMHSRSPCTSVEEPKSPLSSSIAKCQTNVKTTSSHFLPRVPPHFFALLNLFPVGLGLIILEFGQSKYGNFVTLYGIYILKGLGFQCTRNSIALSSHPFFTNLHGIGAKFPEEKLFSSEYSCKK